MITKTVGIFKIAGIALAALLVSTPGLAADSVTFAQFTQQTTTKVAQYANTGTGNTLNIGQGASFFVVLNYGAPGVYSTALSVIASSNALVTSVGQQFEQTGWTGSLQFTDGSNNYLTMNFTDATFSFDSNGGSASLISSDPDNAITFSSNVLTLPAFATKAFSLAFTGLTPAFTVAGNGYGSAFDANIAGSFSGSTDGSDDFAVPEPASWAMLVIGFGLTGVTMRRRKSVRVVAS